MPSLIQKYKEKELITQTRKVWSDINNAFLLSQQDYGVVSDNSILFNATDSADTIAENLAKYFNGAKVCKRSSQAGCSKYSYEVKYASKRLNEDNTAQTAVFAGGTKIILANGAVISIQTNYSACAPKLYNATKKDQYGKTLYNDDGTPITYTYTSTICGNLQFDVNGSQGPNQFGRDLYHFWVMGDRLQPCFEAYLGGVSFQNILSGKDKLEYLNYQKGQTFD